MGFTPELRIINDFVALGPPLQYLRYSCRFSRPSHGAQHISALQPPNTIAARAARRSQTHHHLPSPIPAALDGGTARTSPRGASSARHARAPMTVARASPPAGA